MKKEIIILAWFCLVAFALGFLIGADYALDQCVSLGIKVLESQGIEIPVPKDYIKMNFAKLGL